MNYQQAVSEDGRTVIQSFDAGEQAYELSHLPEAELMRTKYCIRYELGICPVLRIQFTKPSAPSSNYPSFEDERLV